MIIVAHRDRPARFDVEHPTAALSTQGRPIEVTEQPAIRAVTTTTTQPVVV